jgi:hypothetical protein
MTLHLNLEEAEYLASVLERALGEVREEVHHADVSSYKDRLKREEGLIRSLLERLSPRPEEGPPGGADAA